MSKRQDTSGPQFRADRPQEQEAVRTTIVGGRPPGSGKILGEIPRGIEVLVKKAAVDPQFKRLLLNERAEAAEVIGLKLDPAEVMMLAAVPAVQLESIIARTEVPNEQRRAFLGKVAAAMLVAMGVMTSGCDPTLGSRPDGPKPNSGKRSGSSKIKRRQRYEGSTGAQPELPPEPESPAAAGEQQPSEQEQVIRGTRPERVPVTDGIRPDQIPVPEGIRPDRPPTTKGIRPDRIPAPTGSRPDPPTPPPGEAAR